MYHKELILSFLPLEAVYLIAFIVFVGFLTRVFISPDPVPEAILSPSLSNLTPVSK